MNIADDAAAAMLQMSPIQNPNSVPSVANKAVPTNAASAEIHVAADIDFLRINKEKRGTNLTLR